MKLLLSTGAIGGQSRDSRPLLQVLAAAFKEVMAGCGTAGGAGGTANRRPMPNRHGATGSNDLSRHSIYMRLASGRLTISQFLMHTANVACLENCGTRTSCTLILQNFVRIQNNIEIRKSQSYLI